MKIIDIEIDVIIINYNSFIIKEFISVLENPEIS